MNGHRTLGGRSKRVTGWKRDAYESRNKNVIFTVNDHMANLKIHVNLI